jgi:hypothetical protein
VKKEELKEIISTIEDIEYQEHPDEMDLTLFIEDKLDKKRKEELIAHLICCERCRDIVGSEAEESSMEVVNNPFFSKPLIFSIVSFAMVASIVFLILPSIFNQSEDIIKSIDIELNLSEDLKYTEEIKSNCLEQNIEEAKKYYNLALKQEVGTKEYIELLERSLSYCYSAEIATHLNILKAQNSNSFEKKKLYLSRAFKDSYYMIEKSDRLEQQIYIYQELSAIYRDSGYTKEAQKFDKKAVEIQKGLKEI